MDVKTEPDPVQLVAVYVVVPLTAFLFCGPGETVTDAVEVRFEVPS